MEKIRRAVLDSLDKDLLQNAIFLAEKLVSLAKTNPREDSTGDLMLLARAYYQDRQYRRAVQVLRSHGLLHNLSCRYLAAKSMFACKEYEECLSILQRGVALADAPSQATFQSQTPAQGKDHLSLSILSSDGIHDLDLSEIQQSVAPEGGIHIATAIALLLGQVYDAQENTELARSYYKEALRRDVQCAAAFLALVDGHLLTVDEEYQLLMDLDFSGSNAWLRPLYVARLNKYGHVAVAEGPLSPSRTQARIAAESLSYTEGQVAFQTPTPLPRPTADLAITPAPSSRKPLLTPGGRSSLAMSIEDTPSPIPKPNTAAAGILALPPSGQGTAPAQTVTDTSPEHDAAESPDRTHANTQLSFSGGGGSLSLADDGGGSPLSDPQSLWNRALKDSLDAMIGRAEQHFYRREYDACVQITQKMVDRDPFGHEFLTLHVSALAELKMRTQLFKLAHTLVDQFPDRAVAWYTVGCYYLVLLQYDTARHYFNKATEIDPRHAASWIAYGHCYSAKDESDQAIAAYRAAARLHRGFHVPALCIGSEYLRNRNLDMALQIFEVALDVCQDDPLVHHELGVAHYTINDLPQAATYFQNAIDLCEARHIGLHSPGPSSAAALGVHGTQLHLRGLGGVQGPDGEKELMDQTTASTSPGDVGLIGSGNEYESACYCLGHVRRKLGDYPKAIACYEKCLALEPRNPSTLAALGFVHHLHGDVHKAIEYYHSAMGLMLAPDQNTFVAEMFTRAMEEVAGELVMTIPAVRAPAQPESGQMEGVETSDQSAAVSQKSRGKFRELDQDAVTPWRAAVLTNGGDADVFFDPSRPMARPNPANAEWSGGDV